MEKTDLSKILSVSGYSGLYLYLAQSRSGAIAENLETKERDKRMEKAVLKTLVAYLNTDGGVLLVGVDDAGNPRGLEEDNFENVDKMNLHLTHMITNAIGDEFLPYIWFTVLDFDGKQVVSTSSDRYRRGMAGLMAPLQRRRVCTPYFDNLKISPLSGQ